LYYGYNYTRLYLSAQYKGADEKLRDKLKFTEAEELLRTKKLGFLEKIDNPTRKNLEDYDQLLKKTKTEDEYTFEDWFYKGLLAFHSQQYNSAIGYMEEALSLDSECEKAPPANLNIGVAYKRLGLFEHALTIYRKIVKSYPQYDKMYKVYNNIGTALWGLRKADEALEAFDKALEIKPDNAPAFYNKACVYSGTKHKNKMLEYLQKAINIEEEFKIIALSDADFANYWDDDDFKNLV
jgi:tetratricopeptide (TPR) repeat protein